MWNWNFEETEPKTRPILEFIKNNRGRSMGELIRYLEAKQICSRDTARKYVRLLKENDDIIIEKDKRKNNKTLHLFINDKNEFNQIDNRLSYVEKEIDRLTNDLDMHARQRKDKDENWWFQMGNNMWILQMVLLRMTENKTSFQQDPQMLYSRIVKLMVRITKSQNMARRKGKPVHTSIDEEKAIGIVS